MSVPYSQIRDQLRTCDLILFRSHDLVSSLIAEFEKYSNGDGDFTHVGMCIRGESFYYPDPKTTPPWLKRDGLYLLEAGASGICGSVFDVEGKSGLCVQLRDLDQVVCTYKQSSLDKMAVMYLKEEFRSKELDKDSMVLQREYDKYRGLYYDLSLIDLWATVLPFARTIRDNYIYKHVCDYLAGKFIGTQRSSSTDHPELLPRDNVHSNWQFCSKLVSNIYIDLALFSKLVVPSNVTPSDLVVRPESKCLPSIFEPIIYFDP